MREQTALPLTKAYGLSDTWHLPQVMFELQIPLNMIVAEEQGWESGAGNQDLKDFP
jgi:hypothetical protein